MKPIIVFCLIVFNVVGYVIDVNALPLNGEYTVSTSVEQIGLHSYKFDYAVTNINQGVGLPNGRYNGLDGFAIMIPDSAIITNVGIPPLYYPNLPDRWWNYTNEMYRERSPSDESYQWLIWWGGDLGSIYPAGSTAHFTFQADNVDIALNDSKMTTFWWFNPVGELASNGGYYTDYETQLLSPVAISQAPVPEPSTILLLGAGIVGMCFWRRKRKVT